MLVSIDMANLVSVKSWLSLGATLARFHSMGAPNWPSSGIHLLRCYGTWAC